jgi:arsenate reductase (glutaredoxin)
VDAGARLLGQWGSPHHRHHDEEPDMARPAATLYHNPRCSKSRQTLELLRAQGLEPEIVEYLKTPPNAAELERILKLLGREPRELMRTGEAEYKELGLDDPALDRDTLIQAMVDHPKLIERPILLANRKAALGRPPESVLEIL